MTGLRGDQVAELASVVFGLLDEVWQPVRGRRRVLGLYRAVVLTLFLMRRNAERYSERFIPRFDRSPVR